MDNEKFPNGMTQVVDKIHSLGLKAGIYRCYQDNSNSKKKHSNDYPSDAGTMTCAKYPGSLGHEAEDASSLSEWGFDCA